MMIESELTPNELYISKKVDDPIFYSLVSIPYHFDKILNPVLEESLISYADFVLSNSVYHSTLIEYINRSPMANTSASFSIEIKNDGVHGIIDAIIDDVIVDIKVSKKRNHRDQLMKYYNAYPKTKGIMCINFLSGMYYREIFNTCETKQQESTEYELKMSFNTTKAQLIRYCKKNNIKVNQKMSKEEIEKIIIQHK
jgi:hypothetical protein